MGTNPFIFCVYTTQTTREVTCRLRQRIKGSSTSPVPACSPHARAADIAAYEFPIQRDTEHCPQGFAECLAGQKTNARYECRWYHHRMGTDRLQPAIRMWRSMLFKFLMKSKKACVIVIPSGMQKKMQRKMQKDILIDTCVIRTHAPEGIALAGQRVNHSAKVP
jgi:hypothetical protein